MYYSSGNYEAFVRPLKPEGVDHKSAYETFYCVLLSTGVGYVEKE